MKNYIFKATIVVALTAAFYACSSEGESVDISSTEGLNFNNRNLKKLGDNPILFTYNDSIECEEKTAEAAAKLNQETLDEFNNLAEVDQIINKVSIGSGKGELLEIHYLNMADSKVVRSLILNRDTGKYDAINIGVPLSSASNVPLGGPCPQGYTHLGNCAQGTSNYGYCIQSTTVSYQLRHLGKTNVFLFSTIPGTQTTSICVGSYEPN